ncbi:hypothetical protein BDM02DRAFT_1284237 [Thelephora ganbajun]|uniref:Uncharacterized protein n=1 Tax=Thelephora ganbajun TaxID=370292 RepID=A0ACB6Z2E6_THEGA|nr:hypothetical protein BDM02DRAFT_1284237 [Thelephora ganbajun]
MFSWQCTNQNTHHHVSPTEIPRPTLVIYPAEFCPTPVLNPTMMIRCAGSGIAGCLLRYDLSDFRCGRIGYNTSIARFCVSEVSKPAFIESPKQFGIIRQPRTSLTGSIRALEPFSDIERGTCLTSCLRLDPLAFYPQPVHFEFRLAVGWCLCALRKVRSSPYPHIREISSETRRTRKCLKDTKAHGARYEISKCLESRKASKCLKTVQNWHDPNWIVFILTGPGTGS